MASWLFLGTLSLQHVLSISCLAHHLPHVWPVKALSALLFTEEVNIHWKLQWNGILLQVSLYFPKIKEAEILAGCKSIWFCRFVQVLPWESTAAIISSIHTIAASYNVTGLFTLLMKLFILFILTMDTFSSQWNPTFLL